MLNPITTGVAQQIAGSDIFSGVGLRTVPLIVLVTLGSLRTMRYACRVGQDASCGLRHGEPEEQEKQRLCAHGVPDTAVRLTAHQKIALALAAAI